MNRGSANEIDAKLPINANEPGPNCPFAEEYLATGAESRRARRFVEQKELAA